MDKNKKFGDAYEAYETTSSNVSKQLTQKILSTGYRPHFATEFVVILQGNALSSAFSHKQQYGKFGKFILV